MNHFQLNGRLTADAEAHTYGDDDKVMARLRVAVRRDTTDTTDFFDVAVFGPTTAFALDGKKGDVVAVSGALRQQHRTGDDGVNRDSIGLVARNVVISPKHTHSDDRDRTQQAEVTAAR